MYAIYTKSAAHWNFCSHMPIWSSKYQRKSLASKSGFGGCSKFSKQVVEFQKSKIYKGKLVAKVFLQAAKNAPR